MQTRFRHRGLDSAAGHCRERPRACRRPERRPRFCGRRARCARSRCPRERLSAILPCHSDPRDEHDAELVGHQFGLPVVRIDLAPAYDLLVNDLKTLFLQLPRDQAPDNGSSDLKARVPFANIKPRLRMSSLYFIANSLDYLVVGTGNRSELSDRLLHQARRRRSRSPAPRPAAEERGSGACHRCRDPAVHHRQAAERRPLGGPDGRRRDGLLLRGPRTLPDGWGRTRRTGARNAD